MQCHVCKVWLSKQETTFLEVQLQDHFPLRHSVNVGLEQLCSCTRVGTIYVHCISICNIFASGLPLFLKKSLLNEMKLFLRKVLRCMSLLLKNFNEYITTFANYSRIFLALVRKIIRCSSCYRHCTVVGFTDYISSSFFFLLRVVVELDVHVKNSDVSRHGAISHKCLQAATSGYSRW